MPMLKYIQGLRELGLTPGAPQRSPQVEKYQLYQIQAVGEQVVVDIERYFSDPKQKIAALKEISEFAEENIRMVEGIANGTWYEDGDSNEK